MPLTLEFGRFRWSASWSMTLLALAGVALFILLGRWQWHRAAQSEALQTAFRLGAGSVINLEGHASDTLARYSQVTAQGHYDSDHQFLLDNMSHADQPGYEVLTPLQLTDGRTLIVNRGWVPLTESRRHLPDIRLAQTPLTQVSGRLDHLPVPGIALGHAPPSASGPWPRLTSFPTMADLSKTLGRPLESQQLLLDAHAPFGYVRDWQPPGMGPAQHLSYAIQWWAFAAVALVLYVALNRQRRGGTSRQAASPPPRARIR